jgi:hypothetical protein
LQDCSNNWRRDMSRNSGRIKRCDTPGLSFQSSLRESGQRCDKKFIGPRIASPA